MDDQGDGDSVLEFFDNRPSVGNPNSDGNVMCKPRPGALPYNFKFDNLEEQSLKDKKMLAINILVNNHDNPVL